MRPHRLVAPLCCHVTALSLVVLFTVRLSLVYGSTSSGVGLELGLSSGFLWLPLASSGFLWLPLARLSLPRLALARLSLVDLCCLSALGLTLVTLGSSYSCGLVLTLVLRAPDHDRGNVWHDL